jgi:hypothetical protein
MKCLSPARFYDSFPNVNFLISIFHRHLKMTEFVTNIVQNSLSGFVAGAVTTVGGYAGDAVSGIGNLIEQKGQAVGDGEQTLF